MIRILIPAINWVSISFICICVSRLAYWVLVNCSRLSGALSATVVDLAISRSTWPHHPVIRGRTVPTHSRFSSCLSLDRRSQSTDVVARAGACCKITNWFVNPLPQWCAVAAAIRYASNLKTICRFVRYVRVSNIIQWVTVQLIQLYYHLHSVANCGTWCDTYLYLSR